MPIFEYQCHDCSHTFEELTFSRKAEAKCPACGSTNTGKLLSQFATSSGGADSTALPCGQPGCDSGFS
jgi:putative FmdB family regulatory protein